MAANFHLARNGHAPAGTNLGEVAVACNCDPRLHRAVLTAGTGVHACLRCGTVTVTHTVGDDGRHTGNSCLFHIVDDTSPTLMQWLARWPRVSVRRYDLSGWLRPVGLRRDEVIYFSADTRCATVEQLRELEDESVAGVRPHLYPTTPVPDTLPPSLLAFAQCALVAPLSAASDASTLLALADPQNAACSMAVSHLLQRDDAFDVMVAALRSDNSAWHAGGAAMACAATPFDLRLPDVLVEVMTSLPVVAHAHVPGRLAYTSRYSELLAVIFMHPIDTPAIRAALAQLQRRVARLDADLAGRVGEVMRALHGLPPSKAGFSF